MPRPSRNLDQALLQAGRELFPAAGCSGLSVREVAQKAGVNLGMFHYHFKTREAFLRALLQSVYEEMYGQFAFQVSGTDPLLNLRAGLRFMGRFLRDNRAMLARVIADALCGEPLAVEFLQRNAPRHLGVLQMLLAEAVARRQLRKLAPVQALAFCAGALGAPVLFGGAIMHSGGLTRVAARKLHDALLSDHAIDERIDLALEALRP
ncbi:MAG TPA: TetR/AcrR family transcriptional regulator [Usitatibacter sp.]|nr:TetR/AcrR family transcriptional regulator [Usitatibacter sp.]